MDFMKSLAIAASGLRAQAGRMQVISENIANVTGDGWRASNLGAARSLGLNLGVSALATFSASKRWRSWCQCIFVRSIEKIVMSEIGMPCRPLSNPWHGRVCRAYG